MDNDIQDRAIARLRAIPLDQKVALVPKSAPALLELLIMEGNPEIALAALSSPFISEAFLIKIAGQPTMTPGVLGKISENRKWMRSPKLQLEIIKNPQTPISLAGDVLEQIDLNDLLTLTSGQKLQAGLRQHLFDLIQQRLNKMSDEQKAHLLGRVSSDVAGAIIRRGGYKVFAHAIQYNYLREADAVKIANSSESTPRILTMLFESRPWGKKFDIRWGLLNNNNTPLDIRIKIYYTLTKADKRNFRRHKRLPGVYD